jgi:hypothetical protein
MPAVNVQYTREMNQRFGYLATWLPNLMLEIGTIGEMKDQIFEPVSSLKQHGISYQISKDKSPADLDYTSTDAVSIKTNSTGNTTSAAAAPLGGRISVSFKRANAVAFQARSCTISRVADLQALADEILARYGRGEWKREHVVVTDLVTADAATILISNGQDARIDLGVKTLAPDRALSLASADASATVSYAAGIGTRIVAAKGLTPLFKAAGIKRRLIRGNTFTRRGGGAAEDLIFAEIDYKDLSGS